MNKEGDSDTENHPDLRAITCTVQGGVEGSNMEANDDQERGATTGSRDGRAGEED